MYVNLATNTGSGDRLSAESDHYLHRAKECACLPWYVPDIYSILYGTIHVSSRCRDLAAVN
jgi:hypothetical protein